MNKKVIIALLSTLVVTAIIFACAKSPYASKSKINELLATAKSTHSAKWCEYVKESESTITLKYSTMIHAGSLVNKKSKSCIVVIKKSDLSPNELKLFQGLNKNIKIDKFYKK